MENLPEKDRQILTACVASEAWETLSCSLGVYIYFSFKFLLFPSFFCNVVIENMQHIWHGLVLHIYCLCEAQSAFKPFLEWLVGRSARSHIAEKKKLKTRNEKFNITNIVYFLLLIRLYFLTIWLFDFVINFYISALANSIQIDDGNLEVTPPRWQLPSNLF